MGQHLMNPPTVEGWHTGEEWITSGSLVERVNFITNHLGDEANPGVNDMIIKIIDTSGKQISPVDLVDKCVEILGLNKISEITRQELIKVASSARDRDQGNQQDAHISLSLIHI